MLYFSCGNRSATWTTLNLCQCCKLKLMAVWWQALLLTAAMVVLHNIVLFHLHCDTSDKFQVRSLCELFFFFFHLLDAGLSTEALGSKVTCITSLRYETKSARFWCCECLCGLMWFMDQLVCNMASFIVLYSTAPLWSYAITQDFVITMQRLRKSLDYTALQIKLQEYTCGQKWLHRLQRLVTFCGFFK